MICGFAQIRKLTVPLGLAALSLAAVPALAGPPFARGGGEHTAGGGGSTSACGSGGVCAQFQAGQAFVTWPDVATGATGGNYRYRLYRSTAPITAGNYASATLIASYIFNNSAQLFGGNPDVIGGASFTQANRQDPAQPMSVLTNLGTPLDDFTGLQVYTATGNGAAYYAIVSTDTSDGSPTFIGSVGPIAETVASPAPIKFADSLSRAAGGTYGKIDISVSNMPVVFSAHASSAGGGCAGDCRYGDYWEWFLTPAEGWQDGRATVLDVTLDKANTYSQNTLEISNRDTLWNPLGTGGIESFHQGVGMTPNPLAGIPNRMYRGTAKGIARMLNWAIGNYGADPNQLHWIGRSMGAWGGANTGMRMTSPQFSALWLSHPMWRMDFRGSAGWAGNTWTSAMPFRATVAAAPDTLGTTASAIQLDSGETWGGTGGYVDMPTFIAADPGTDLPVTMWMISRNDGYATWAEQLTALDAFQSAHRGHAFVWYEGVHSTNYYAFAAINCDWAQADAGVCYSKSTYQLDLPYLAFSNSSIDDDPGTATPGANGMFDGAHTGCINCGFSWNVTADTASAFDFTVDNAWMDRSPTVFPSSTLVGTMAASGGGSVAVASTSGWLPISGNIYALVGDDASPATQEVVTMTSTAADTVTFTSRGQLGTTAQAHGAGVAIKQLAGKPTGPMGGPYSTMTVDIAIRRAQGGLVPSSCTVTPFGESPAAGSLSFDDGIPVLTGVKINATGATSVACD